ncbi:MAG: hypothetical protein A3H64_00965 [Candidatus Ryanbacteria bacterium RIFCSPLOWO2_02_FULL_45_11c]|uniref:Uncharacterized protein n=1 Tax=Candidatus Ryanbacteria bacterium RIFCSPLOWO2_02_FULL_45_11c TaxID=1802128 RepID=A0A1G2H227_9BACT|nr:MAG: hypothetical protein A3H64_00965 [Candidatus Ryanbacteria bacterium RIFCSPLOWO2_02_FULL_45_11c]
MKKSIVIGIVIIILAAAGGFMAWQKNWLPWNDDEKNTVILREDLPPAPAGYKTIDEDPTIAAEIPPDVAVKYQEGFEELVKTIEEHPDSFGAWFNLGSVKNVFGDYKGAEEAWLYATEISPLQARSLMNLADLYRYKLKDYQKTEWAYISAIERGDASVDPISLYYEFASFYRNSYTGKKELAISIIEQGLAIDTEDNSDLLALAGMWAWEDGNFEKAAGFYEQYLVLNPDQVEAKKDLERIRKREPLPQ